MVKNIYEKGWANDQLIKEGDMIKLVNGENPEVHFIVTFIMGEDKQSFFSKLSNWVIHFVLKN